MKKNTVLIIEDNEINREILQEILQADYNIYTACNGQEGMEQLREHKLEIDIVLLDIQMPVMDGYEVLETVSKDEELRQIPIVVTTGNDDSDEEERCLMLKATEFIRKPYNPTIVRLRVESLIRMRNYALTLSDIEIDKNTGVYTREAFYHYAQKKIDDNPDKKFTIVMTDVVGFRRLRELYGVSAFNLLRKEVDLFRVISNNECVAGNYSVDQMIFLLPISNPMTAEQKKHWYEDMGRTMSKENGVIFKAGVSEELDTSIGLEKHIQNVYAALMEVKKAYNHYTKVVGMDVLEKMQTEARIEELMETALKEGQMAVYYQPKHDAKTNELVGAEALVRWISPELGFVSPGVFIPVFEKNGFVSEVDAFVWHETCKNQRRWIDKGLKVVPISVNASRQDFEQENLRSRILDPVQEFDIPENLLHLEITESLFSDLSDMALEDLSMFRCSGIKVELDDFGSGYSSLNSLSELPIDTVKFDIGFVRRLTDPRSEAVMHGSAEIVKALNLKSIAEGVEDEVTRQKVADMGIDTIQGYLYSKPLPVDEFEEYLRACGQ